MKCWGAEMYWSSRAGKCLAVSMHEPTGPKGGSNHSRQSDPRQQPAKRTKTPIYIVIASRNKSHCGGRGTVTLIFFSAGRAELPKVRHLWDGKSSAVGKIISGESSQGSTVCLPCFGTSCLISVGFYFVPVTHCLSLQAFAWNRACPLLWGREMPKKRGDKLGLRNLTSITLMLMMALPES